jgi:hypothetical protein
MPDPTVCLVQTASQPLASAVMLADVALVAPLARSIAIAESDRRMPGDPGQVEQRITYEIERGSLVGSGMSQAKIQSLNGVAGQAPRRLRCTDHPMRVRMGLGFG